MAAIGTLAILELEQLSRCYTSEPMNGHTRSLIGKTPHKQRRAIALASGRKNTRVRSCAPWYYIRSQDVGAGGIFKHWLADPGTRDCPAKGPPRASCARHDIIITRCAERAPPDPDVRLVCRCRWRVAISRLDRTTKRLVAWSDPRKRLRINQTIGLLTHSGTHYDGPSYDGSAPQHRFPREGRGITFGPRTRPRAP